MKYLIGITITNPTLMSMCPLWGEHVIDIHLNIILSAPFPRFYVYDIMSCDHGHIPLHFPRNKKTKKKLN